MANASSIVVAGSERGGPCRHCLRESQPGERLALTGYRPFDAPNPYAETGPIFLHADGCERYAAQSVLPENYRTRPLVLRAYDARHWIADAKLAAPGAFEETLAALLAGEGVSYVHARHVAYGCYAFRVERAP
ncbi:MAG TPA: DUF1203 domain-containing protein [Candidatus Baltobacteraceae bacterium]|nr:DUF1203 domain-containing protein [Candidatus Baltobacteraceae bacterium]